MSFAGLLTHTLTHVRVEYDEGTPDDRGYPTPGTPTTASVRGLVQPRSVHEMIDYRSAGTEIGDHVIFLEPMDLRASDAFTFDGDRYEILGIREVRYGSAPHLEVDARKIAGAPVVAAGS